ncbi:MAG: N-acetylneuraminate synthase family protein [Rhodospirillales bacterium]|nr:N-acetylneuraminate synthase family protein [Rhodospirillales bacterium]
MSKPAPGEKPNTIIAEIGSVHDGSFGNACKLIEAGAGAGADAVKFQTHIAAAETINDAPMPPYFVGEPRFEYFERTGFSLEQWRALKDVCGKNGVTFLSSPFSLEAVELLEDVGVDAYKVPSGEVTNIPLLKRIAETGKPVLLSSGMSDWAELDAAMAALEPGGSVTVMQCTTAYPCPPEQVGLNVIGEMRERYGGAVGYSDHTLGFAAGVAAATLGATVIEKHFTLSKLMYGSDAAHSMEPKDFQRYCEAVREAGAMAAVSVDKNDVTAYRDMKRIFEKSIVAARPIPAGSIMTSDDLAFKKPGDGIRAARYETVIGRTVKADLPADHKFVEDDFA